MNQLLEVVLDLGREAEVRFASKTIRFTDLLITEDDINYIVKNIGDFGDDNRAGIERTLHRISAITIAAPKKKPLYSAAPPTCPQAVSTEANTGTKEMI